MMAHHPLVYLDTVQETEDDRHIVASMTELQSRPSLLRRLSTILPFFTLNDSKYLEDSQLPVTRKPAPLSYHRSAGEPPRESLPPTPISGHRSSSLPQPPPLPHRLQKPGSPNILKDLQHQFEDNIVAAVQSTPNLHHAHFRADTLAPPDIPTNLPKGRVVSSPISRPSSAYNSEGDHNSPDGNSRLRRKSWLPGSGNRSRSRSRHPSQETTDTGRSGAWINAGSDRIDYNLSLLIRGEKVPELWDDSGNVFVYLFHRSSDRGASFRVPSIILSSSEDLIQLIHGTVYPGRNRARSFDGRTLAVDDATRNRHHPASPPHTPQSGSQTSSNGTAGSMNSLVDLPKEIHLHFPLNLDPEGSLSPQDVQSLVDVRNMFAFLTGQPLVGTPTCPTPFRIFIAVSTLLKQFEFTNFDGSTYGEAAAASFNFFLEEMDLADVAMNGEKTLEGIILGERMRCRELYDNAFAHAVGQYDAIQDMKSELYNEISQNTRNRLERAHLDLKQRQSAVDVRLTEFDFPSMFAGFAASTTSAESKFVRFKGWKLAFSAFRKHVLSYYKDLHGQWPPKASSKKNNFIEGGLNRLVLKGLYKDFCDLYDLLADRESLTTRSYDASADEVGTELDPAAVAVRKVLSEFDRSSPPVQPPVPFDLPKLPTIASIEPNYPLAGPKDQHRMASRKLKDYENLLILAKSHNFDVHAKTPFLEMFREFEEREAKGKSAHEMIDQRYGYWLFMYGVIQSLPMLVVDAPTLRHTEGVEYFLCEPPLGNAPWIEDGTAVKMSWYNIQGSQGVVSLPSDIVLFGVEGIYRRSHCWTVAEKWISAGSTNPTSIVGDAEAEFLSPLAPPPGFAGGELGARPNSRGRQRSSSQDSVAADARRSVQRNSIALGLERLPIPSGPSDWSPSVTPVSRPGSRGSSPAGARRRHEGGIPDPGKRGSTFDDILSNLGRDDMKGKKK
ncbi:hypothetical protein B7494_g8410 [Chlorociboria aeruginascens]|nr:hypothetical protein B7494_g8410 [Chlorociboria aeruginascens]